MLIREERPRYALPRPSDVAGELRAALTAWPKLAAGTPLTVTLPLPGVALDGLPAVLPELWYWARPEAGLSRLATGVALTLEAVGARRLPALAERLAELRTCWHALDPAATGQAPVLFLGLAFDAAQAARLTLPLLALNDGPHGTTATFAAVADARGADAVLAEWLAALGRVLAALRQPPDDVRPPRLRRTAEMPAPDAWLDRAASAVQDIRGGRLEKVVLTRTLRVTADAEIDAARLTRRLAERHAGCAIIAVQQADGILVAATPERLAKLSGGRVASDALAGTCRRDADPGVDADLARRLLSDPKERHEHRLVVDWITQGLNQVCTALSLPDAPRLMTLPRLQHLWTPVRGRLRGDHGLLDVLHRLHPTPAVAGLPVEAALSWLRRHHDVRPDWYTGAAGWLDLDGDGEMHVVLRAALLRGNTADLFAGAGIVAQSEPRAELAETELKLRTMLEALADG